MNEAIKLAIEKGGYEAVEFPIGHNDKYYKEKIALDPLFWQALGKALGENREHEWFRCENENCKADSEYVSMIFCSYCGTKLSKFIKHSEWWKTTAMQYFDLVLTGGDTEKFFKELLK